VVIEIVRRHAPDINESTITTRFQQGRELHRCHVTIEASSKQQLNAIYQDLHDHPHVLMVL